jgi:predicted TIM-barrel fold metal-dependent hydrolase
MVQPIEERHAAALLEGGSEIMTSAAASDTSNTDLRSRPLVVVSSDSHIGPRLKEDLRPYCESRYLEEFDEFVEADAKARQVAPPTVFTFDVFSEEHYKKNQATTGHYDSHARLRDMDYDGIACEVIFHGSQNGQTLPFMPLGKFASGNPYLGKLDFKMAAVGQRMYNRWLADFVSGEPERHVGLVHIPIWDPELAIAEVEWGLNAGLRGVNLPVVRSGVPIYGDRVWDRMWSLCCEHNASLHTHGGAGDPEMFVGPEGGAVILFEGALWQPKRALPFMVFGGVFERFPTLRLLFTETPGIWWTACARDLDSIVHRFTPESPLRQQMPGMPSEYMKKNIFWGGTFLSRAEAHDAVDNGYSQNVIWGGDYPHAEGTFQLPQNFDETPQTHLSMRYTFAGLPAEDIVRMTGENAIDALGLDRDALTAVAARINAPTVEELSQPLEVAPTGAGDMAFRRHGAFA